MLDYAQDNPLKTEPLLLLCLSAIRVKLARVLIIYPTPNRVQAGSAIETINQFLQKRTGGRRFQAVVVGLFRVIGLQFGLFDQVESGHVNVADRRSGHIADLTCRAKDEIVLVVEVKDRKLNILEIEDKLPQIREQGVEEVLYVIRGGIEKDHMDRFESLVAREFKSGHNLYSCEFDELIRIVFPLLGEKGRRDLLVEIGKAIDEYCELVDREAWSEFLQAL